MLDKIKFEHVKGVEELLHRETTSYLYICRLSINLNLN